MANGMLEQSFKEERPKISAKCSTEPEGYQTDLVPVQTAIKRLKFLAEMRFETTKLRCALCVFDTRSPVGEFSYCESSYELWRTTVQSDRGERLSYHQ